ncbi:hypothetical protein CY34DRAFT_801588 [Suillus luteus UH-Slu-Lm8-n1]|uniref:Uncharacterized protein n=1 Tax=Suillus luteus UH-Slu-Lm8-n1 TaxID=930992 RepID=A0A0D0BHG5_9AGAM|nr:hypothetical protein CY34DRAFT_801588 [Suillus luteus UH-Slu-Lm8-n1]
MCDARFSSHQGANKESRTKSYNEHIASSTACNPTIVTLIRAAPTCMLLSSCQGATDCQLGGISEQLVFEESPR